MEPLAGTQDNEYVDVDLSWLKVKQIRKGGAILVRPDSMVAWRSFDLENLDRFAVAFDMILGFAEPDGVTHVNGTK